MARVQTGCSWDWGWSLSKPFLFTLASFSGSLAPPPTAITFPRPPRGPSRPRPSFGGREAPGGPANARLQSALCQRQLLSAFLPATLTPAALIHHRNKNHSPFPGCSAGIHARSRAPLLTPAQPPLQFSPSACRGHPSFSVSGHFANALDSANNHSRRMFSGLFSHFKPDFKKHLPKVLTPDEAKAHPVTHMLPHTAMLSDACKNLNLFH